MTVQTKIDTRTARPLGNPPACDCVDRGGDPGVMLHRHTVCKDEFATAALSIIRFIAAAYATSDAACWEAAFAFAEGAVGAENGPLLVARTAALVRLIRRSRNRDLCCLPSPCNRLTVEEKQIMMLVDAARRDDRTQLAATSSMVVDVAHQTEASRAASMIGDLLRRSALTMPCRRPL
jgi:hypothetical protein